MEVMWVQEGCGSCTLPGQALPVITRAHPNKKRASGVEQKKGANPPLSAINPDERYPDLAKRYNNTNTPTTHPPNLP